MVEGPGTPAGDARSRTSALIRERHGALSADVTASIAGAGDQRAPDACAVLADLLLRLFAASVRGRIARRAVGGDARAAAPGSRTLDARAPRFAFTRPSASSSTKSRSTIVSARPPSPGPSSRTPSAAPRSRFSRRTPSRSPAATASPACGISLTTLIAAPCSISRWSRKSSARCAISMRSRCSSSTSIAWRRSTREHGWGVGDRLLERMAGIFARRFFRTHDWVARHGGDGIAVLLPETTIDQAAVLASRFREMVQHRFALEDHRTRDDAAGDGQRGRRRHRLVRSEVDPCRRHGGGARRRAAREIERPQPD